jgi:hypothetical protein
VVHCDENSYQLFKTIRDNGGWTNWVFEILEIWEGDYDIADVIRREGMWMLKCNSTLNIFKNSMSVFGEKDYLNEMYSLEKMVNLGQSKKQTEQFKQAQETLAKQIRHNRPNITDSSVKTYVSLLSNMYYREHSRDDEIDLSYFHNASHLMEVLKDKTPQARKTVLAAIVVLNGEDNKQELIEKQMKEDVTKTNEENNNQTKNEKQTNNWESYDTVKQLQQKYQEEATKLFSIKGKLDETKHELLTRYMMLTLSSGVYFPPRRSEMVLIKVKDIDQEKDNYIDLSTNEFVYNQYKTVRKYGQQRVKFPSAFKAILKKYLSKISGQTYLLENKGQPYLATQLTRELNKIFGKKISTSMLRHIYLSDIYKDVPALKQMQERASEMGHSLSQSLEYVKH